MADFAENRVWQAIRQLTRLDVWDAGADGNGTANELFKGLVERTAWLKARVGIAGTWNTTGTTTPATPVTAVDATVTDLEANNEFTVSFNAGDSNLKGALSAPFSIGEAGGGWAKFVMPALDGGDTVQYVGVFVCNAEATVPDLMTAIGLSPSEPLVGTVTWFAAVFHQVGAGSMAIVRHVGGYTGPAPAVVVTGDTLYAGVDAATRKLRAQVNAGTVVDLDLPEEYNGSVKVGLLAAHSDTTPVFAAGTVTFSLGTADGGKLPFGPVSDATLPLDAADGMRYLVTHYGTFAGRQLRPGDLAELSDGLSSVVVTPGAATLASLVAQAQFELSPLQLAMLTRTIVDVASEAPAGAALGSAVIVHTGAGDWVEYDDGDLAIRTATGWARLDPDRVAGVPFVFQPLTGAVTGDDAGVVQAPVTAVYMPHAVAAGRLSGLPALTPATTSGISEATLLADCGWGLSAPASSAVRSVAPQVDYLSTTTPRTYHFGGEAVQVFHGHAVNSSSVASPYLIDLRTAGFAGGDPASGEIIVVIHNEGSGAAYVRDEDTGRTFTIGAGGQGYSTRVFRVLRHGGATHWIDVQQATPWTAPGALLNSWANVGGAEQPIMFRRIGGKAQIRGAITAGTDDNVFQLPAGLDPQKNLRFAVPAEDGVADPFHGVVAVTSDGYLKVLHPAAPSGHSVWIDIEYDVDVG